MEADWFRRLSGAVVLIAGFGLMLFFLVFEILSESVLNGPVTEKLLIIMGLAFAVGSIALCWSFYLGKLGNAGSIIAAGTALLIYAAAAPMIYFQTDAGWLVFIIFILLLSLGLFLFGIGAFRKRYFCIGSFMPLVAGVIAGSLAAAAENLEISGSADGNLGFILRFVSLDGFFLWSGIWLLPPGTAQVIRQQRILETVVKA